MKCFVLGENRAVDLNMVDPETGCDTIYEFIGNNGGFTKDFQRDPVRGFGQPQFVILPDAFAWWEEKIRERKIITALLHNFVYGQPNEEELMDEVYAELEGARDLDAEHAAYFRVLYSIISEEDRP